jgi:hypothetical protein
MLTTPPAAHVQFVLEAAFELPEAVSAAMAPRRIGSACDDWLQQDVR